jgi:hypothetical protein
MFTGTPAVKRCLAFMKPKYHYYPHSVELGDCAIAQVVSRWFPTMAARVQSQVRLRGICGGQSGTGAGFLGVQ